MKYTKEEVIALIWKQLEADNEMLGKKKKRYSFDYIVTGIIHSALKEG